MRLWDNAKKIEGGSFMKGLRAFFGIVSVIVAMVMLFPGVSVQAAAPEKQIELRLAHMFPLGAPSAQHMERWAEKIAKDSSGRLKLRIFPVGTLLNAPDMHDGVAKGAADIGFAWRYSPKGDPVNVTLPFILGAPDLVIAGKVYDDLWKKFPKVMADEWKEVKVLYLVPTMAQYFFAKKPLRKLDDFKGLQIRVPSKEIADFVKDLGGSPVYMSTADFVVSIEKGTVDGGSGLFASVPDNKMGKNIRFMFMEPLSVVTPIMLIMNKDTYNGLPKDLQQVIGNSIEWAKADALKYWSVDHENCVKYCKDEGIEMVSLSKEDKARWKSMIDRARERVGKDLDAKGVPGTDIVRFIRERVDFHTR